MVGFPNAKINIGLNITERRTDGFHTIESVFYPVEVCDVLEVIVGKSSEKIAFTQSGIAVPPDGKKNLCERAYELLDKDLGLPPVKIHLHKIIPIGAGLGGGSADAAVMLKMLNDKLELSLSWGELHHYARQLGSDCSFFITNKPAWVQSKGDDFEAIDLDLSNYKIALLNPGIHIGTAEAYSMITPKKVEQSCKDIVLNEPPEQWRNRVVNDFEIPIFKKYPAIQQIKEGLYEQGALYASMSGSGSTVYGIFKEQKELLIKEATTRLYWSGGETS